MYTNQQQTEPTSKNAKQNLSEHLDSMGWALFLIMTGGLFFAPEHLVPRGAWLTGMGIIILGISALRYYYQLPLSIFWLFIGAMAFANGLGEYYAVEIPIFPIALVIAGLSIVYKLATNKENSALKGEK